SPAVDNAGLLFVSRRPAEAGGDGGPIVFALEHVFRAAVIEAEDFVVDVQPVHDERQTVSHADAALRVEFKMAVEIVVAERTVDAAGSWSAWCAVERGRAVMVAVGGYVRLVVREPDADGEPAAVEGRANVPAIRRIAKEPGVVRTTGKAAGAGGRIAIIGGET